MENIRFNNLDPNHNSSTELYLRKLFFSRYVELKLTFSYQKNQQKYKRNIERKKTLIVISSTFPAAKRRLGFRTTQTNNQSTYALSTT